MNVNKVPVLGLFESKQQLEVPLFQRQYVWERERQWEPLWEDIERKFEEAVVGRSDAPVHFLGAMVLDQKQTPVTHVGVRQVIDGQQRLTTLQLFLAAFRDACAERGWAELAKECASYLFNAGMMARPNTDRFKVWPTQADRPAFADVLTSESKAELLRRHPEVRRKYARAAEPRHRMVEAYLFFREVLDAHFVGESSADSEAGTDDASLRAQTCFQALKSSLMVVVIDLDKDDDPQLIFETLNARGEPLLPADLLRNNLFLRARRDGLDIEALYDSHWRKFDEEFWREPVVQGRLLRPRSDIFLQHFLSSRQGQDVRVTQLYAAYRHWIGTARPFANVREELETLSRRGDDFRRIIAPPPGDAREGLARVIAAFDVGTVYPLLLAMAEQGVGDDAWRDVGAVLESYLLRRDICGLGTAGYNKFFLQLMRNLGRERFDADALRAALLNQSETSFRWPDDATFQAAWLNEPIYGRRSAGRVAHVLRRLNDSFGSAKTEAIVVTSPLSVEHLMPVDWRSEWPLPDGQPGLSVSELEEASDDDPRARATRARDRAIHTVGNLTLITQPLNSAQSNSSWDVKRPELLSHSLLPINLELSSPCNWDEGAIQDRGRRLFERALSIWPR